MFDIQVMIWIPHRAGIQAVTYLNTGHIKAGFWLITVPVLKLFGVDAVGVEDGAVPLDDADTLRSGSAQVPHGVETHVTEALDDEGLVCPAWSDSDHVHVLSFVDKIVDTVEHTATGGWGASVEERIEVVALLLQGAAWYSGLHYSLPPLLCSYQKCTKNWGNLLSWLPKNLAN